MSSVFLCPSFIFPSLKRHIFRDLRHNLERTPSGSDFFMYLHSLNGGKMEWEQSSIKFYVKTALELSLLFFLSSVLLTLGNMWLDLGILVIWYVCIFWSKGKVLTWSPLDNWKGVNENLGACRPPRFQSSWLSGFVLRLFFSLLYWACLKYLASFPVH